MQRSPSPSTTLATKIVLMTTAAFLFIVYATIRIQIATATNLQEPFNNSNAYLLPSVLVFLLAVFNPFLYSSINRKVERRSPLENTFRDPYTRSRADVVGNDVVDDTDSTPALYDADHEELSTLHAASLGFKCD